jgi:alkylation response protein AidB-like acyl-CoA dehydrogenase
MTPNFDLGTKHTEYKQTTQEFIQQFQAGNFLETANQLLKNSYGIIPSNSSVYDDYLGLTVSIEEIAKFNPSAASILVDQIIAQEILSAYSNINSYDSNKIYAVLCSEPGVSYLDSLNTKAVRAGNGWKLEGIKQITNEQLNADEYFVFAKDEEEVTRVFSLNNDQINSIKIEKDFTGTKININQAQINIELDNSANIAAINDEFERIQAISRTLIAAIATGISHNSLIAGIQVVKQTKGTEGQAVASAQSTQFTLADLFAELEAGRVLLYLSAEMIDKGNPSIKFSTMAKIQASDSAAQISMQSLQLLGNLGYIADAEFADVLKAALNTQIKGGTNRTQKNQLYKYMLAKK